MALPLLERLGQAGLLSALYRQHLAETAAAARAGRVTFESDELDPEDPGAAPASAPASKVRPPSPPHLELLRLCARGALEGGLSVALDVRPDELVGALCAAIGGSARKLKVLDVREGPPLELWVGFGELEERWELEDLYALVQNCNSLFEQDARARSVAILGEWEDSLQLWCLDKTRLEQLLRQDYFAPRNRQALESAGGARSRGEF